MSHLTIPLDTFARANDPVADNETTYDFIKGTIYPQYFLTMFPGKLKVLENGSVVPKDNNFKDAHDLLPAVPQWQKYEFMIEGKIAASYVLAVQLTCA